jgi:hypothetical protein
VISDFSYDIEVPERRVLGTEGPNSSTAAPISQK